MGDVHLEPTLALVASLKMTQTRYSMVALVWKVTEESRMMLTKLNVRVVDLHPVSCPQTVTRHDNHHLLMQFAASESRLAPRYSVTRAQRYRYGLKPELT